MKITIWSNPKVTGLKVDPTQKVYGCQLDQLSKEEYDTLTEFVRNADPVAEDQKELREQFLAALQTSGPNYS